MAVQLGLRNLGRLGRYAIRRMIGRGGALGRLREQGLGVLTP